MAGPLTTVMTGLEISNMLWKIPWKASSIWKARSGRESSTATPAENALHSGAAWIRTSRTLRALCSASMARPISSIMSIVRTL